MTVDEIREYICNSLDDLGRFRTLSLFLEHNWNHDKFQPIFTIKDRDYEKDGVMYISLRRLYLEIGDPTEYDFAVTVFGSWKHWQKLCNNRMFSDMLAEWREELEVKMRSDAIRSIVDSATSPGQGKVAAARYIAEKGWDKRKAGRPTNEQIKREAKIQGKIDSEVADDLSRLGLH